MKTKLGKFVSVLSMLGLLASCAQMTPLEAENANARKAAENAKTYADHDKLAKQYQNVARESLVKAEEQKKVLQQYGEKSYLYGRQGQDFESHNLALLRKYEQTAEESVKQASYHQKIAAELAKRDYAAPAETQQQRENKVKVKSGSQDNAL
ncbi:hypothetical protein SAMN05216420_104229 [Nitrosospira sp. Nl5]|uniref:hypothetical protein n=1 Tax=Nitrosospira sp. Nl5 TaxID=200120 RepID=UPI0008899361|nr:hypothetical protein [Nitrosospira sp. Nl5]SCY31971.1 hypothetical protein SAMN05216420_104229 [Nitrosospira sp. Nl5]